MFVQTPHFSGSFHFAGTPIRCFLASMMPFFHNGTFHPQRDERRETHQVAQRKTATSKRSKTRPAAKSSKTAKSAKASPKTRAASGRGSTTKRKSSAGSREVTIDRRRSAGRRKEDKASAAKASTSPPKLERRKKVNRRRQIDPTTCERDYTEDEIQFMNALDEYKRASGRMFPTCSEVLEVVRSLGYVRLSPGEQATSAVEPSPAATTVESDAQQRAVESEWQ